MHKTRWFGVALLILLAFGFTLIVGLVLATVYSSRVGHHAVIAPTATLVTQIQSMNELVTVKYVVEKVVKLEAEPSVLGRDRIVLLVHAIVKAGVDLQSLRPDDVQVSGKKVIVTLPSPRITDCYIDDRKTEVWEHATAFWRPMDKDLEQNARRQALDQIRLAVGEAGLQKEALERARQQLRAILPSLGFKEVEIKTRP